MTDGGTDVQESHSEGAAAVDFDDEKLLNGIGLPLFMLDTDRRVIAWNERVEQLSGVSGESVDDAQSVREALYPDGERTLAEHVLDNPDGAHQTETVTLSDEYLQIYERERVVGTEAGERRHYESSARPLYKDGDLAAVLQTVQDRTEAVRRHEAISGLVEELRDTFTAMANGDLGARAAFDDPDDHVDESLRSVVDDVNVMAEQLESLADRVDAQASVLAELGEESKDTVETINRQVGEQHAVLDDVGEEMEQFSANMEELASRADQIAASADDAQQAAADGRTAGQQARTATDNVLTASTELVETVQALETSVEDIETVLEVIDDVAEQTNMLALNASIESARAGKAGDGFGIVADEIKKLASETREHTQAIDESIADVQTQAERATEAVEDSHEQIQQAGSEIDEALTALDEIAEAVDETASGVQEVADANDQQATTVQEVLALTETARDHADSVAASTEQIGELVDAQQSEVAELQARVDSLSQSE